MARTILPTHNTMHMDILSFKRIIFSFLGHITSVMTTFLQM